MSLLRPQPSLQHVALALLVSAAAPMPVLAQITVNQQDTSLIANNSGDISLNTTATNPTIQGGTSNTISMGAQGAASTYSISDTAYAKDGTPLDSTAPVSVTGAQLGGSNSGKVSAKGSFSGIQQYNLAGNLTIAATGNSSTIAIKTTGK